MRLVFLFTLLLCDTCFISCGDNNPPHPESTVSPASESVSVDALEKRVILLIDVSGSITEESKKLAAQYARRIANGLADESHLLIYTTEKNIAQQAIVDIKKATPLKPLDRADFEARIWPSTITQTHDIVLAKCNEGASTSCILDGLKSVRTGLAGASKARQTYLLVISDMLEDCELGHPETAKDFAKMKLKLEKSDLNDFQIASKIPQEHVQICYINQNARPVNAEIMASPEFRAFWQQAFKMLGYSGMPEPGTSIDAFLDMII